MTRTLAEQIAIDVTAVHLADFGETVTYRPQIGEAREILANIEQRSSPVRDGTAHEVRRNQIVVMCADDGTTGITTPNKGDRLEWNDLTWTNPQIVRRTLGEIVLTFDCPVIETSGRQRRGGL